MNVYLMSTVKLTLVKFHSGSSMQNPHRASAQLLVDTYMKKTYRQNAVSARGCLPPGANVFVAAPTPAVRSPIVILMVTTMALLWTVNSTLSWGSKLSEFHIFAPPNADPCTVPFRADAPFSPPSRRH